VLECASTPRHRMPYGNKDRPFYATASLVRAKVNCDLVLIDFPGDGLWFLPSTSGVLLLQAACVAGLQLAECSSLGLYRVPSRNT
jgi:hypothetical protein